MYLEENIHHKAGIKEPQNKGDILVTEEILAEEVELWLKLALIEHNAVAAEQDLIPKDDLVHGLR